VVTDEDPDWLLCDDEPLLELSDDEVEPLPELSLDAESLPEEPLPELPLEEDPLDESVVDDPLAAAAVVADELASRLPVAAITPKASAKVASAAAVIRRRIILMRRARALRR
jgi:hypothetical protein